MNKIIVITGARQVGKTTLLRHFFRRDSDVLWLNADEQRVRDRLSSASVDDLRSVVGDYNTIVIDEIQRVENAGLVLKLLKDNFQDLRVVVTGSSALEISDTIFEPLTGRHVLFYLPPLSVDELYQSQSDFEIEGHLGFHLQYGFYPDIFNHPSTAEPLLINLANQYLYKDVLVWKDIRKPQLLDKLLKLLALQIGSEVSLHELGQQLGVKSQTIDSYIDLLEKSFVVFRLSAFSRNPRTEINKMDKIYFWDLGIRNAILGDFSPIENRLDKGSMFENLAIVERKKFLMNSNKSTKLHFWRNYNQSEVDLVEVSGSEITAIEFKWKPRKKSAVSRAFTNAYPAAKTRTVSNENLGSFVCR